MLTPLASSRTASLRALSSLFAGCVIATLAVAVVVLG